MELTLEQALQKGVEAHKAGKVQEADRYYTAILKANPKHPDANHNMGVLAVGVGKVEQALPFFKAALEVNQTIAQFWLSYIDALIKLDRMADAKGVLDQAKSKGAKGDAFEQIEKQINATYNKKPNTQEPSQEQLQGLLSLYTQDHYQEALNKGFQLLKKFPHSLNLYNIVGAAYKGLGKLEEAIEAYNKALSLKPDYADAYYNMGAALQDQGKPEEAIEAYTKALSIKPDNAEAYNNMGNALQEQGKLEGAIEAYNKALAIKPDYAEAYSNMGATLQEQGKLKEAIEAYNKALSLKPDYADAYNNLGNALKDQGKLEEAIEAYNKALSLKPDYADAYYNMGAALQEQGKLGEAIEAYTKALSIKPDNAEAYNNMGNALQDQGKLEEAIEAYNKALAIKPDNAEAYNNMGVTLQEQGKLEEALEAYNKALSLKPNNADAYNNVGVTLQEQGKLEEALEAYNKALSLKPDYADAYSNMGATLQEQGKLKEAIEAYNKALSLKPDYADAYSNMGNALKEQGKLKEAIEAYNKALAVKPDYAAAYYNMGNALKEQGKLGEAIEAYNKALSIKSDYAKAHSTLSSIKEYTLQDKQFLQAKELYGQQGLSEDARCHLSFALAKMYEDIGDLDQNFTYLSKGNALRKKLLNYSIDQDKNLFSKLKNAQSYLLKTSLDVKAGSIETIPVFIIGMPRSGTTLVEQIISSHSEVLGAGELNHVSQLGLNLSVDPKVINTGAISKFRQMYLSEVSKLLNGKQHITDKMPQNFRFIPLICAALPEAKIIHVQRNAAATCWSNFKQYFAKNGIGYCYDLKDIVDYYKLYNDLTELWQSQYGDRIYNLNYESLTTDQENQTRKLIKYLELKWDNACLSPHKNKRSVRTASQQQVRQKVYQGSSKAWQKYESYLNGAFDSLRVL